MKSHGKIIKVKVNGVWYSVYVIEDCAELIGRVGSRNREALINKIRKMGYKKVDA